MSVLENIHCTQVAKRAFLQLPFTVRALYETSTQKDLDLALTQEGCSHSYRLSSLRQHSAQQLLLTARAIERRIDITLGKMESDWEQKTINTKQRNKNQRYCNLTPAKQRSFRKN